MAPTKTRSIATTRANLTKASQRLPPMCLLKDSLKALCNPPLQRSLRSHRQVCPTQLWIRLLLALLPRPHLQPLLARSLCLPPRNLPLPAHLQVDSLKSSWNRLLPAPRRSLQARLPPPAATLNLMADSDSAHQLVRHRAAKCSQPHPARARRLALPMSSRAHLLDLSRAARYSPLHPARARRLAQHLLSHAHPLDLHPAAKYSQLHPARHLLSRAHPLDLPRAARYSRPHPARARQPAQPTPPASVLPGGLQPACLAVRRSCSLRRLRQARQALHLVVSLRTSPSPLLPQASARQLLLALLSLHLLAVCPRLRSPRRLLLRTWNRQRFLLHLSLPLLVSCLRPRSPRQLSLLQAPVRQLLSNLLLLPRLVVCLRLRRSLPLLLRT